MDVKIENSWKELLKEEFDKPYFTSLVSFVKDQYRKFPGKVFPPGPQIFNAFDHTTVEDVKVVIIGQDPYHGKGQANGLCFSVNKGVKQPPSLQNIFKAIQNDLGISLPDHGDLSSWAQQGVLMLNATLTVREKSPGSHQKKGWEIFTDAVIQKLSNHKENLVFLLWGSFAQSKEALIPRNKNHLILKSSHPSPFSAHRGFLTAQHFSKTNTFLKNHQKEPIDWSI